MIKACEDDHGEIRNFFEAIGSREEGWSRVVRDCISCLAKTFTTHVPGKKAPKSTTKEHTIDGEVKDAPSPQPSGIRFERDKHAEKANGQPASRNRQKVVPNKATADDPSRNAARKLGPYSRTLASQLRIAHNLRVLGERFGIDILYLLPTDNIYE